MNKNLFFFISLLIQSGSLYSLEHELQTLKEKLTTLHHALQQSSVQSEQPERPVRKQQLTITQTPLWNAVEPLYKKFVTIKINTIHDTTIKKSLEKISHKWEILFQNFAAFEETLHTFLEFIQQHYDQHINEPQEFIQLVTAFKEILGDHARASLEKPIENLTRYASINKKTIDTHDKKIAFAFFSMLSQILTTLANEIEARVTPIIKPSNVQWEGKEITAEPIDYSYAYHWVLEFITGPLHSHWQAKQPYNIYEFGLNSGIIHRALEIFT